MFPFIWSQAKRIRRWSRRPVWYIQSRFLARNVYSNGKTVLIVKGRIEGGRLFLGHHYGIFSLSPSFIYVGVNGVFLVEGSVYFYGDNIVRVEEGATLKINQGTRINIQTSLNVKGCLEIGRNCYIGQGVHIRDNDGHKIDGVEEISPVRIGDNVWIGYHVTILKGVTIGPGAVVAAKSVVINDVPAKTIVGGHPARVIRTEVEWKP